jgi:hypothetical protein
MIENTTSLTAHWPQLAQLAEDQASLRADFVALASHGRQMQAGLERLSELLVKPLERTEGA